MRLLQIVVSASRPAAVDAANPEAAIPWIDPAGVQPTPVGVLPWLGPGGVESTSR
jgi:hypothetical protein